MKFAICNETFAGWPLDKALAFAAKCGYTGIELAPFTLAIPSVVRDVREIRPAQRAEIRHQADAAGLEVVGLHWLLAKTEGLYLTSPDPATRRRTAEYLGELARLCHDLGGWVLVLGSPQQRNLLPGVTHEQALDYAVEVYRLPAGAGRDAHHAGRRAAFARGHRFHQHGGRSRRRNRAGWLAALPTAPRLPGHVERADADPRIDRPLPLAVGPLSL